MAKSLYSFPNWKNPPCPSSYKCTTATIVNEARGITGYVQGSVVRENVLSVEISFNVISCAKWSKLMAQFDKNGGGNFFRRMTVFDQRINAWRTATFYVSDRDSGELGILDKNKNPQYWKGASFTLVMK